MRLLSLFLAATAAGAACKCEATYGVCRETGSSNVIFIGTVESIAPTFLDTWNESQKASLSLLNHTYEQSEGDRSPAALAKLRDAYLQVFPDLPPEHKRRLERAVSAEQLADLFYWILDHGKRVRFSVSTVYRNSDADGDDEDDDADDDADAPRQLDIWTAFGDCGVNFQTGETYLVYADSDEESDIVSTTTCHRTRRLSEAGEDLAFLYFRKTQRKMSGRLEVFVTRDTEALKAHDRERYSPGIGSPVVGSTVVLEEPGRRLRAEVDESGRAVFDGLSSAAFTLSVFAPGYPREKRVLVDPKTLTLDKRGCGSEVLVVPPH